MGRPNRVGQGNGSDPSGQFPVRTEMRLGGAVELSSTKDPMRRCSEGAQRGRRARRAKSGDAQAMKCLTGLWSWLRSMTQTLIFNDRRAYRSFRSGINSSVSAKAANERPAVFVLANIGWVEGRKVGQAFVTLTEGSAAARLSHDRICGGANL